MVQKIFNTLSKRNEIFIPLDEDSVNLFVCGPTVYDFSHLGHAKTYTQFDFIVRYLRRKFNVTYLMNITDIDDKIIKRSEERGVSFRELATEFEHAFFEDMAWLKNDSVSTVARSHDFIKEIVNQIERMKTIDAAYQLSDGWYFDLTHAPKFGELSGRKNINETNTVSRIGIVEGKRNSGDFVLWKNAKPGEPFWETSLGKGRPGWHIEDTAITEFFFGEHYDIHGGAVDLIFPHHEAEIAQMESISNSTPLANFWLHTGLLNIDGFKMAKSDGNFITIRSLKESTDYRTLRFLFLYPHYRNTIEFSKTSIRQAVLGRRRVENFYSHSNDKLESPDIVELVRKAQKEFFDKLDNDFDTPSAFGVLYDLIRTMNREGSKAGITAKSFLNEINELMNIFDFSMDEINLPENVLELIEYRDQLRADKKWLEADKLRDQINSEGVILEDSPTGTVWFIKTD